jgi:MFS family permease
MSADPLNLPVRRNTLLLSASLATNSAMLQLSAAVATLSVALVVGIEGLLGLGPAVVLGAGALTALPAGRAMDRFGRRPVLAAGFAIGAAGGVVSALGVGFEIAAAVLIGLMCVGAAGGISLLARTAAGDMYPPERRARGIALVLFGTVFGAILGPAVFSPLLSGRDLDSDALVLPWLAAAGFMVVGLFLVLAVRPDPQRIAELLAGGRAGTGEEPRTPAAPLSELIRRPGVIPSLLAAVASFSVMVSVMTLTGYVVVEEHGHAGHTVFPIIAAHVVGMYALVLVVGDVIDRIGRIQALVGGLVLMAVAVISLLWITSVWATALALFTLGLGWNFSFVAATAQLADRTAPHERGKLLGFNDLLSGLTGAGLALLGGYALSALGVAALAIGATLVVLAPAAWISRRGAGFREAAPATIVSRRTPSPPPL